MRQSTRMLVSMVVACAVLAPPAVGVADSGSRCKKAPKVGYVVNGTLVGFTPDDPATPAFEGAIQITVTSANRHATNSGDIADQNASEPGIQVEGAPYSVSGDPYTVDLVGFEGADTPSPGDDVQIIGKITKTKAKCAPAGTSLADRYGAANIRKVIITDKDVDA